MDGKCCSQESACSSEASCLSLLQCLAGCGSDTTCQNNCATQYPAGVQPANALGSCYQTNCSTQCS
jgi:hypothetical protein